MTGKCSIQNCKVFQECCKQKEMMNIPLPVMESVMRVLQTTTNYNRVVNNVSYDFEFHGVNLRNYYGELLNLSERCLLS